MDIYWWESQIVHVLSLNFLSKLVHYALIVSKFFVTLHFTVIVQPKHFFPPSFYVQYYSLCIELIYVCIYETCYAWI